MENDKNKSGDPVKKGLNNEGYISKDVISNEEIENFEVKEETAEKQKSDRIPDSEVSTSNMDPDINKKGTFSVKERNLSREEKRKIDQEGGGEIGEGRGSGADH